MALFKISKGNSGNLPTTVTEGYAWFTSDNGRFYIDASSTTRVPISGSFIFDIIDVEGRGDTANSLGFYLEGTESYSNIKNAFEQNLVVYAKCYKYSNPSNFIIVQMIGQPDNAGTIYFGADHGGISYQYYLKSNGVWGKVETTLATSEDLEGVAQISLITWESGDDGSVQGE